MTPEQREIATANAQRIVNAGGTDAIDYPVAVGFLSLIAQVEALTVPQVDEPAETIKRIQRMNMQGMADCMDMVHGELIEAGIIDKSTPPMMIANAVCSYIAELHARLRRALSAPTIPAIPGTKEGA